MERLKHLERERVRLEYERERQMERFQREKDLEPRHKRHERSPGRHKTKKSRYTIDSTTGHHSHNPERHRKIEARGYKSSSKETKRSKESSNNHKYIDLDQQQHHIHTTDNNIQSSMPYSDDYMDERNEYNTIEVNIRDEGDEYDYDDEEEEEEDDGGGDGGKLGGDGKVEGYDERVEGNCDEGVEEGELDLETKEDEDYINAYNMAKSKFDEEEEEAEDVAMVMMEKCKSVSGDSEQSDVSVEREFEEEEKDDKEEEKDGNEEEKQMETKEEESKKEVDKKLIIIPTTTETPPSPPSPTSPRLLDSPPTQLPPFYPAIQGCRNVEEFHCLNRVEEGTYGVVYRAVDRKTQDIVALKRLKMEKESEGFPITSLREINTLLKCTHENVVKIREVVVGSNMDKIYLVMDFVEHDLKSLMEYMKEPFLIGEVKTLMMQLLSGISHLHDNWVVHRDLKTSNLLLSNQGVLKIGDFGLAREYGSPLKPYTPIVVTLWYRAPELLLGQKIYSTSIDIWSAGCIFAELVLKKPLFAGRSELDQLNKIFKDLGTPNEKIWPGVTQLSGFKTLCFSEHHFNRLSHKFDKHMSARGFEFLNLLLTYCPEKRLSAEEALKDPFFSEVPIPVESAMFPTWPSKSELKQGKLKIGRTPKAPSGGEAFAKIVAEEANVVAGFQLKSTQKPTGFALRF